MLRRGMLQRCLSLLGLAGVFPRIALGAGPIFRRPRTPVSLPLDAVKAPWSSLRFDARFPAPHATPGKPPDVLLKGILLRVPAPKGGTRLKAFCLHCPHELCYVNLARPADLAFVAPDVEADHPLAVCPCHFSVFDPVADGARLAGPSPRGLYRFRLERGERSVEVVGVEEAALK